MPSAKSACAVCPVCSNVPADCEGHLSTLKLPEAVFYGSDVPFLVDLMRCIDPSSGELILDDSEVSNIRRGRAPSYKSETDADSDSDADADADADGDVDMDRVQPATHALAEDPAVRRSRTRSLVHAMAGYSSKREDAPAYKVCKVTRDSPFPISRKLPDDDEFSPMDAVAVVRVLGHLRPHARAAIGMTADDMAAVLAQMPSAVQVVPRTVVRAPVASASGGGQAMIRDPVAVALEQLQRAAERAGREQMTPALRRILQDAVNGYHASLEARMPGKDGRWQDTLISKRSDQSGRGVIVGDPNLAPDEVGVPYAMANQLCVDVRVFSANLKQARERVAACNKALRAGLHESRAAAAVHGVTWGNGKKYAPRNPAHQVRGLRPLGPPPDASPSHSHSVASPSHSLPMHPHPIPLHPHPIPLHPQSVASCIVLLLLRVCCC